MPPEEGIICNHEHCKFRKGSCPFSRLHKDVVDVEDARTVVHDIILNLTGFRSWGRANIYSLTGFETVNEVGPERRQSDK